MNFGLRDLAHDDIMISMGTTVCASSDEVSLYTGLASYIRC